MKIAALISVLLAASLPLIGSAADSEKRVIVGHGDGEITLLVPFRILDGGTGRPLQGAEMIFYDRRDCARLALIDAQRSHGIVPTEVPPSGNRGVTGPDGRVAIACRFFAAFPIAYQGGQKIEVPPQVYPDGFFLIVRDGYESLKIDSSQLFTAAPYEPDHLKKEAEIKLKRQPTKPVQINAVDAPRNLIVVTAISRSPRRVRPGALIWAEENRLAKDAKGAKVQDRSATFVAFASFARHVLFPFRPFESKKRFQIPPHGSPSRSAGEK